MKKVQQGFTLIELMIVVAIIGILAAIAIPQYQDFIARSQVTEAINLLGGAKTAIEESVTQDGSFPATTSLADLGIKTSSKYVFSIVSSGATTDGTGTLTALFQPTTAGAVSSGIAGKRVSMARVANGDWTCKTGATTPVLAKHLPKVCR